MARLALRGPGATGGTAIDGQSGTGDRDDRLEELYRDHYAATVRLAGLLVGDYQLGEEIAQDAFARLFESFETVLDPTGYLHGTVVNLCRARFRRAVAARRLVARAGHGQPEVHPDPGDDVATRSALQGALLKLPRREREAVVLRFYGRLPEAAIAEAMGVSAGSVKSHLSRAIASLRTDSEELR